MKSNDQEVIITEGLLVDKLKKKDISEYKCNCCLFFVIIFVDLILTAIYCFCFRRYIITERTSYHNVPYFPFINMTFLLDFNIKKEQIECYCSSAVQFNNGSRTDLKKVNWASSDRNLSYFPLEMAFKKEDLNLNEGDSLYIYFFYNEKNYTKLQNKHFYLSYVTYFLNSNNQLEYKHILGEKYYLKNEIELSIKNKAYPIFKYKKVSYIIDDGIETQKFSSITEYGNVRFMSNENADLLPGFEILIEDTKELRISEVVAETTFGKSFFKALGSISLIINVLVAGCCLIKNNSCIKRVHSSRIEASNRDNLPNNEFNNNNNGIIAD